MPISYQRALDKMREKGMTTYKIRKENFMAQSTLQKLRNGQYVTTEVIEKLCLALDCTPNDLMEITPPEPERE
ncbi:helix-turn-helix transcriptional regulator [Oscillospiraceae bacterium OttesenSCG-928-G22]|nr:helix-turn-helix transcriptional regulator [Oscillospiraceae bacterium OttesenSCG-928-G22]